MTTNKLKGNNSKLNKQERIPVESKKQKINDEDEFYWEEIRSDVEDEMCYICETNYDEEKLIICDYCLIKVCHTYCDNELLDDTVPSG